MLSLTDWTEATNVRPSLASDNVRLDLIQYQEHRGSCGICTKGQLFFQAIDRTDPRISNNRRLKCQKCWSIFLFKSLQVLSAVMSLGWRRTSISGHLETPSPERLVVASAGRF